MIAKITVDLGFGDSGKGVATDSLCINSIDPIVVRYSGGPQCGHNVCIDDKTSHIHSSFGSGTLRGIPSYFTEHTMVYPTTLFTEYNELLEKNVTPKLFIHPLAIVITPYDVLFNRRDEINKTHGTVGLGIGATMRRHNNTINKLYVSDLFYPELLNIKLGKIKEYYEKLDSNLTRNEVSFLMQEFNAFYKCLEVFHKFAQVKTYAKLFEYKTLIFEASQGVMLDKDHGTFPNITYSNTTSKNAEYVIDTLRSLADFKFRIPTTYYLLARAYTNRHGNGWMPNVGSEIIPKNSETEINSPNEWQGTMRTTEFSIDMINYAMSVVGGYSHLDEYNTALVISCVDQIENEEKLDKALNELKIAGFKVVKRYSPISTKL